MFILTPMKLTTSTSHGLQIISFDLDGDDCYWAIAPNAETRQEALKASVYEHLSTTSFSDLVPVSCLSKWGVMALQRYLDRETANKELDATISPEKFKELTDYLVENRGAGYYLSTYDSAEVYGNWDSEMGFQAFQKAVEFFVSQADIVNRQDLYSAVNNPQFVELLNGSKQFWMYRIYA